MSAPAVTFVTYLWHYVLARLLYDDLVRPLAHGDLSIGLLVTSCAGLGYAVGRRSRRRR